MLDLPFDIPKSLRSYVEQYRDDPLKATTRLKNQLKKRGPDAVGYFLLAWFYHLKGMNDEALEQAMKAKIFAPGSPFLEKLHYYLAHPQTLDAWEPTQSSGSWDERVHFEHGQAGPVLEDLDALIEKLSEVDSQKITISKQGGDKPKEDSLEQIQHEVEDIVSETLASIHERQGKVEAALRTYQQLKSLNREKKDFYKQKISELKKLREKQQEKEKG